MLESANSVNATRESSIVNTSRTFLCLSALAPMRDALLSGSLERMSEKPEFFCDTMFPGSVGSKTAPEPDAGFDAVMRFSCPARYSFICNKMTLLNNPERVMNEGVLAFASSFWFWLDRGCGSSFWSTGFGATTNIINGGLECGGNYGGAARNRETYYGQYLSRLGVSDSRSKSAGCGGW